MSLKRLWLLVLSMLIMASIFSCLSQNASIGDNSNDSELDQFINNASNEIIRKVSNGTRVALYNMSSIDKDIADYIVEEISLRLVDSGKITVVERSNLDALRAENNFQLSGDVDDEQIISIGHMSSAQSVISCKIAGIGNNRRFTIRTLDVKSGINQSLTSKNIKNIGIKTIDIIAWQINNIVNNSNDNWFKLTKSVAFVNFTDFEGNNNSLGKQLVNYLNGALLHGAEYTIVPSSRSENIVNALRVEMGFAFTTGFLPEDAYLYIGKTLVSGYIISGRMTEMPGKISVTVQLIQTNSLKNISNIVYSNTFDLTEEKYIDMYQK